MGKSIRLDIDLDSRNRRSFNGLEAVQGLVAVLDRIGKAWWGLVMLGEVLDDQAPRKTLQRRCQPTTPATLIKPASSISSKDFLGYCSNTSLICDDRNQWDRVVLSYGYWAWYPVTAGSRWEACLKHWGAESTKHLEFGIGTKLLLWSWIKIVCNWFLLSICPVT